MTVQTPEQYETSLHKLFPRGPYWDRQFADPHGDCSLFCRAKLDALVRFRTRMNDLQDESMIQSALETIEDWERIFTGTASTGLTAEQRRALLGAAKAGGVTSAAIVEIGRMYGVTITGIRLPFKPAFFGFSRFGIDRAASPASFSVLFIDAVPPPDGEVKKSFESMLAGRVLANHILYFVYGGA